MSPKHKAFIVVGTTAILAAAGLTGGYLFFKQDSTPAPSTHSGTTISTTGTSPSTSDVTIQTQSVTRGYKDGQYHVSRDYKVPDSSNNIKVTLELQAGTIRSVGVAYTYRDKESVKYLEGFKSNIRSAAVGKDLSTFSPSRIGGASLTTDAFRKVLDTIRDEAKA